MEKVVYICGDCGKPFRVPQGSRRQFCTRCGNRRVQAGRSRRPERTQPVRRIIARSVLGKRG